MAFEDSQMHEVVYKLAPRNLFKSMTTHLDHTIWQDVTHAMTPVGVMAYINHRLCRWPAAGDPCSGNLPTSPSAKR